MSTEPTQPLDPELLVARIIGELQANPDAQRLLLRAMLTNEFLGMPARLDRIEQDIAELKADVSQLKVDVSELKTDVAGLKTDVAELKTDVAELKTDMVEVKADVAQLKTDVAYLRGSDLENRLHRNLRSTVCQELGLMRPRILQSQLMEPINEFADQLYDALQGGRINADQYDRAEQTDFIIRAIRKVDRIQVLVAVEASATIDAHDVQRARQSADVLATVFETETIAVVAGGHIDPRDMARAKATDVRHVPAR